MKLPFFFGFLVSSNTLSLQITKKHIFELLIAFNIIHLIYKIVHNIYLTSIALKTTLGTVKQPTISKHKGVAKNSTFTFFFLHFLLGLVYGSSSILHFLGAMLKQST